jgi:segregation and condensation protein A
MVKKDYTVRLERVFQGPMDLLLHLVREQEVEIHEISIARILEDYLRYLDELEALDIELAGDFLVMAATLMSIKSRSLLPGEEVDLEEELDPRDELIQRLLEYRRFRNAADTLEEGFKERGRQADRGYHEKEPTERAFDLGEVTPWDLLATFSRLMRETLADRPHHITTDPRPLRWYVDQVVAHLRTSENVSLRSLIGDLAGGSPRETLVGSFCALLELVRLELIDVQQVGDEDDIEIQIRPEHSGDLEEVVRETVLDEEELREGGHFDETEPAAGPAEESPPA